MYVPVRTLGIGRNDLFPFPPPPQCSEHILDQTLGQRELCAVLCCSRACLRLGRGARTAFTRCVRVRVRAWGKGGEMVR